MAPTSETVLLLAPDTALGETVRDLLVREGYEVTPTDSAEKATWIVRGGGTGQIVILADGLEEAGLRGLLTSLQSSTATDKPRVLFLTPSDSVQRALWLDQGADDVLSIPWDEQELLAHVRSAVSASAGAWRTGAPGSQRRRELSGVADGVPGAGGHEKMTRDAFSLERILKFGVGALLGLALVIAGIFFGFSRKAEKESRRAYTIISQLEHSVQNEQQLLASARRLREDPANADLVQQKEQLQQQTEALRKKISAPDGADVTELRHQLDEATGRLTKLEGSSQAAEAVIRDYAPSVCLLHVSVAFNEKDSGKRLRYGGITGDGSPLKDSDGNTVYTTEGRAPEVRADFFLAAASLLVKERSLPITMWCSPGGETRS